MLLHRSITALQASYDTSEALSPDAASAPARRRDYWLYLILLGALVLRTFHLGYPVWDYHNWRQSITLMLARDFSRHDFPLLHPQVAWIDDQPTEPSYFSAEFSVQSILAAVLYNAFGESDTLARVVVIGFSLLGIYCLYDLMNRRAGPLAARLAAFLYALFPYHLFFGRVFMPDIPAISLALAAVDVLDRWTDERKPGLLLGAALLTALALLQKLTVIFVALPLFYLFWRAYGRRLLVARETYAFAVVAGVPPIAWYAHDLVMASNSALSLSTDLAATHLSLWLSGPFLAQVFGTLARDAFSPIGLGLVALGIFLAPRSPAGSIFRLWLGGAGLLLFLIPGTFPANLYYLSLLLPGGAALAGLGLAKLAANRRLYPVGAAVLALFAAGAIYAALPLYAPDRSPRQLGVVLNNLAEPDALLATETGGSPAVLYSADRRGWLLEREYKVDRIEVLKHSGAHYYADSFFADLASHLDFFHALDTRFLRLTTDDAPWQIYDLGAQAGPLGALPEGELQNPRTENFGGRIQLRGVTLRQIHEWPAAYEAVYYWQCLETPPDGLRVFVHVTDGSRLLYQQDHWPQGGRFPTGQWKPGDLIRERYVLALPDTVPAGKYQLWLGWFDPARGPRLPILNPGATDFDDRALGGEVRVPHKPASGWFTTE